MYITQKTSQLTFTCSKSTIETPEWHKRRRSGVFIFDLENISHLFLVFPLLTLYK